MICLVSSLRSPAVTGPKKKSWREEEEDLTKDMEDPTPEPNIQEVQLAKQGNLIPQVIRR